MLINKYAVIPTLPSALEHSKPSPWGDLLFHSYPWDRGPTFHMEAAWAGKRAGLLLGIINSMYRKPLNVFVVLIKKEPLSAAEGQARPEAQH